MNKFILIFFITPLAICLHGQTTKNLSLGSLYSNLSGLNSELSYSNPLTNNVGLVGRLAYNFDKSYGARAGLSYRLIKSNFLNLDFGAEYNYERHKVDKLNDAIVSSNLEFPLTLSYILSSNFELYGGISSSINLNDAETNRFVDNLRLGISYKW